MFWSNLKQKLQAFNQTEYLQWLIDLVVTSSTLFLNSCVTLLQIVAICFCFVFMAFHSFPTSVGKNLGCDVALERSTNIGGTNSIVDAYTKDMVSKNIISLYASVFK